MKAITYANYGSPDVLQLKEVEKPVPKDDEVLIRVQAAEATKGDVEMRSFRFAVKWFWLPLRIVFGAAALRLGAYGEYIALPASYAIVAKPTNMSFAEAAAVASERTAFRLPNQWARKSLSWTARSRRTC